MENNIVTAPPEHGVLRGGTCPGKGLILTNYRLAIGAEPKRRRVCGRLLIRLTRTPRPDTVQTKIISALAKTADPRWCFPWEESCQRCSC